MTDIWSKKQRREMRELQGLTWERELEEALQLLRSDFDAWERGEISAFDLSDRIHKFHNGRSRELFNAHSGSLSVDAILRAIATDVIAESELSDALRDALKDDIARFREQWRGVSRTRDPV